MTGVLYPCSVLPSPGEEMSNELMTKDSVNTKIAREILVLNCGSSSLKFKMISMPSLEEILGGEVQRIGAKTSEPSKIVYRVGGKEETVTKKIVGYREAFSEVMNLVEMGNKPMPELFAHRYVHGGTEFRSDAILSREDLPALVRTKDLAPVHNPPVIDLISYCMDEYPGVPQAIILDTEFHSTIPDYAATYPIPKEIRNRLGIRKYGFHGISHRYVTEEAARFLGIPMERLNAVSCHLGSGGASLCAVVNGKSVDNSMGFSPLLGLVMSTRSGDLDPAIVLKMIVYSGGDDAKVNRILNKKSGVLGLYGSSSDIRDVIKKTLTSDDDRAQTALDVYLWRIKKYLGAYLTAVGSVDAITFTDTIGETMPLVRETICRNMDYFGIELDEWKNTHIAKYPADVSTSDSRVRVLVVKTDEETAIAQRAYRLSPVGSELPNLEIEYNVSGAKE